MFPSDNKLAKELSTKYPEIPNRPVDDIEALEAALQGLAGTGRTSETVKATYDLAHTADSKADQAIAQTASLTQQPTTINLVESTWTLDIANKDYGSFKVTSADANAKTIAVSNVPAYTMIDIEIVCTTACAVTYPWLAARWASGAAPTLATGRKYKILAWYDGTAWNAVNVSATGWAI